LGVRVFLPTFPIVFGCESLHMKLENETDPTKDSPPLSGGYLLFLGFLAGAFVTIALAVAFLML